MTSTNFLCWLVFMSVATVLLIVVPVRGLGTAGSMLVGTAVGIVATFAGLIVGEEIDFRRRRR